MPSPFPPSLIDAVAACTRALAGSPDAAAALARADAATAGGLRAFGDRLAIRQRFHDETIDRRHRPADLPASEWFGALERARLDALGAAWLEGIARNLLAHPGADDDGLRWLAFEIFSGRPAPGAKAALAAVVRARLPPPLLEQLTNLAAALTDQERFSAAAAGWVGAAATFIPLSSAAPDRSRMGLRTHVVERYERLEAGARSPQPQHGKKTRSGDRADGGAAGPGATAPAGVLADAHGYHAFTTAHDRVVDAVALENRAELAQLRDKLNAELGGVRSVVARLAKRLLRILMARQVREWRFDLDEGVLDGSRLAPLVASRGGARPFKQESESPFPRTVVSLLIDLSGSMRGRPMLIAALTVEIFARVLERCGVECEILGFTTRDWDGGEPAREWAGRGYPADPGRLNALEHIVVKSAGVPWRRARVALGLFLHDEMLKENIDGEAVAWAYRRLLARTEPRRILVVVSDGTPMDEATMAANGHEYLEGHLQRVVGEIEAAGRIQLAAIGIGHDVSLFYRNATKIARIEHLGPALTYKLTSLLAPEPTKASRSRRRSPR